MTKYNKSFTNSVAVTIEEINQKWLTSSDKLDRSYRKKCGEIFEEIDQATSRKARAAARRKLYGASRWYLKRRRINFRRIVKVTCEKYGRKIDHICKVGHYEIYSNPKIETNESY
jgi:hypothetical protein